MIEIPEVVLTKRDVFLLKSLVEDTIIVALEEDLEGELANGEKLNEPEDEDESAWEAFDEAFELYQEKLSEAAGRKLISLLAESLGLQVTIK